MRDRDPIENAERDVELVSDTIETLLLPVACGGGGFEFITAEDIFEYSGIKKNGNVIRFIVIVAELYGYRVEFTADDADSGQRRLQIYDW